MKEKGVEVPTNDIHKSAHDFKEYIEAIETKRKL